jgi:hypothetical protein
VPALDPNGQPLGYNFWWVEYNTVVAAHHLHVDDGLGDPPDDIDFDTDPLPFPNIYMNYPANGEICCPNFTAFGSDSSGATAVNYTLTQGGNTISSGSVALQGTSWTLVLSAPGSAGGIATSLTVSDVMGGGTTHNFTVRSGGNNCGL